MGIRVSILVSIAAAAAFFFIEPYLIGLGSSRRALATLSVFMAATGLAWYFRTDTSARDGAFLSDNKFSDGLKATVDRTEVSPSSSRRIASGNRVKGKAEIDIKDSKL